MEFEGNIIDLFNGARFQRTEVFVSLFIYVTIYGVSRSVCKVLELPHTLKKYFSHESYCLLIVIGKVLALLQ